MFVVIVDITVKEGFESSFEEAIVRQGKNSLELEPGCLRFDVLKDPASPLAFTLYEAYTDEETFRTAHRNTPHFERYAEATKDWVSAKSHRTLTRIFPA
jgi:autoinducer 2-degrading protein